MFASARRLRHPTRWLHGLVLEVICVKRQFCIIIGHVDAYAERAAIVVEAKFGVR
jgi:hypothetical protein